MSFPRRVVSSGLSSCRAGIRRVMHAGCWAFVLPWSCHVDLPVLVVLSPHSLCHVVPGGGHLVLLALINLGDMAPAPCVLWLSVSVGGLVRGAYLVALLLIRHRQ